MILTSATRASQSSSPSLSFCTRRALSLKPTATMPRAGNTQLHTAAATEYVEYMLSKEWEVRARVYACVCGNTAPQGANSNGGNDEQDDEDVITGNPFNQEKSTDTHLHTYRRIVNHLRNPHIRRKNRYHLPPYPHV